MAIVEQIKNIVTEVALERPGRKYTLEQWAERLAASLTKIEARAAQTGNPEAARRILRHVTGIERWGQSRLRVFLGEPFSHDECDGYAPGDDQSLEQLVEAFRQSRAETIALTRRLAAAVPNGERVLHNQFGPLSARGWLAYLHGHAARESMLIRRGAPAQVK